MCRDCARTLSKCRKVRIAAKDGLLGHCARRNSMKKRHNGWQIMQHNAVTAHSALSPFSAYTRRAQSLGNDAWPWKLCKALAWNLWIFEHVLSIHMTIMMRMKVRATSNEITNITNVWRKSQTNINDRNISKYTELIGNDLEFGPLGLRMCVPTQELETLERRKSKTFFCWNGKARLIDSLKVGDSTDNVLLEVSAPINFAPAKGHINDTGNTWKCQ